MHAPRKTLQLATVFLAASAWAETPGFRQQTIAIPAEGIPKCSFIDVDDDKRSDLLALDSATQKLLIYRQKLTGFSNAPDQVIDLPNQTAWVVLCDVDRHPGPELLMSTASGLVYLRQDGGVFESQPQPLVQAQQVWNSSADALENPDLPPVLSLGAESSIPIVHGNEAVPHQRDTNFEWKAGPPIPFSRKEAHWGFSWNGGWSSGSQPAQTLLISESSRPAPPETPDELRNEAASRIIAGMENQKRPLPHGTHRVDVNGDGRPDILLWHVAADLEPRTDLYLFLCGPDGQYPESPSQILHCRGLPVGVGDTRQLATLCDLKNDQKFEIVLAALKSSVTTPSSMVEMITTKGLEWTLTIRTFKNGSFAKSAEDTVHFTTMLPEEHGVLGYFQVKGDFNGDGRPDLLVKRSTTTWDVFFSTPKGWFMPQPGLTFEIPVRGEIQTQDLNGDGVSDLFVQEEGRSKLILFLSKSDQPKKATP